MTRVFITGMGVLSPIGSDVPTFWSNLLAGKSGASRVTSFDYGEMPYNIACEVKGFRPEEWMDYKAARRVARCSQFAVAVAKMALRDAGITITPENRENIGVLMATGGGGITDLEAESVAMAQKGWRTVGPFAVPKSMANAVCCNVSIEVGARGPVMTSSAACASGHYSMIDAYHFLQRGEADLFVAGGSESAISLLTMSAFGRMGPLSGRMDDPEHACRPFSVDRDGFVAAEGAAAVILETEEHRPAARGATIYGEVLGGRLTADAYHITAPDPDGDGAARALAGALKNTGLQPEDIDLVFAHGTGTVLNDAGEAKALKRVFGAHIDRMHITSIKSMVGHALGAAGAQAAVAAVMALRTGKMPPTINYTPDPTIDIPIVGNVALDAPDARHAIVNAFGFGGQNVVAIFAKVDEP